MSDALTSGGDFSAFDDYATGRPGPEEQVDADRPAGPATGPGADVWQPAQDEIAGDPTDQGTDAADDLPAAAGEDLHGVRPERPATGNARVDAATASLDQLDRLPTPQHADVFDEVHRRLQGALADLDVG